MEDKEILMFMSQATDAYPAQSTQGMKVKAKSLFWLSQEIEALLKKEDQDNPIKDEVSNE